MYCLECRKPPFEKIWNCAKCGQSFARKGPRQVYCRPCFKIHKEEWRKGYTRVYYEVHGDEVKARQRQRRIEIANGAPKLRHFEGHPRAIPKDPRDCLRCGVEYYANAPNQKFCLACKPLALAELNRKACRDSYWKNKGSYARHSAERWKRIKDDETHRSKRRLTWQVYRAQIRRIVLGYYAGGRPVCMCCGEAEIDFLTIDHINNDGAQERRSLRGFESGIGFYNLLIKRGFPPGYQTLCYDYNCSKGKHGECVHKKNMFSQARGSMTLDEWMICPAAVPPDRAVQASAALTTSSSKVGPLKRGYDAQSLLSEVNSPRIKLELHVHG